MSVFKGHLVSKWLQCKPYAYQHIFHSFVLFYFVIEQIILPFLILFIVLILYYQLTKSRKFYKRRVFFFCISHGLNFQKWIRILQNSEYIFNNKCNALYKNT